MSFPINSRNEGPLVTMDDTNLYDNVDRCLWNHAGFAVQTSLRLFCNSLLVHLSPGQKLLEQPHVSVWDCCYSLLGYGG